MHNDTVKSRVTGVLEFMLLLAERQRTFIDWKDNTENNSLWTDAEINCQLAVWGRLLYNQSCKEPTVVTDAYVITTATKADRLVMFGHTNLIWLLVAVRRQNLRTEHPKTVVQFAFWQRDVELASPATTGRYLASGIVAAGNILWAEVTNLFHYMD